MNHAQAVIYARMSDEDLATCCPEIAKRHYPVLRKWAEVGGKIACKGVAGIAHMAEANFTDKCEYEIPVRRRIKLTGPGGTYSYPEPLREGPVDGTRCYVLSVDGKSHSFSWSAADWNQRALAAGFVHLTREAVEEHARAIILAQGGTV